VVAGLTLTIKPAARKRGDPLGGKSGKVYVIYPFRFFYQKRNDSPPPSVSGWGLAGRERDSESFERGAYRKSPRF